MSFKTNTRVIGQHAFLSPSTYHWLDYDEDKLRRVYFQREQARRGDRLHVLAKDMIDLGVKLPDNGTTLSMYVNDAIGFRMEAEVPVIYSEDCFGTVDTLCCRNNTLRIHDLKTGVSSTDIRQLKIYAAIFCFQWKFSPDQLRIILRIYQNDDIFEEIADPIDIAMVMDRVQTQAALIAHLREED